MTLIEVVAGLALLGSLLAATLLAYSAHLRQIHSAQERLAALEELDRLLLQWHRQGAAIPFPETGVLSTRPQLRWRTQEMRSADAERLLATVVRVTVEKPARGQAENTPVCQVELLVPIRNANAPR